MLAIKAGSSGLRKKIRQGIVVALFFCLISSSDSLYLEHSSRAILEKAISLSFQYVISRPEYSEIRSAHITATADLRWLDEEQSPYCVWPRSEAKTILFLSSFGRQAQYARKTASANRLVLKTSFALIARHSQYRPEAST